jgi:hypothetical protein
VNTQWIKVKFLKAFTAFTFVEAETMPRDKSTMCLSWMAHLQCHFSKARTKNSTADCSMSAKDTSLYRQPMIYDPLLLLPLLLLLLLLPLHYHYYYAELYITLYNITLEVVTPLPD